MHEDMGVLGTLTLPRLLFLPNPTLESIQLLTLLYLLVKAGLVVQDSAAVRLEPSLKLMALDAFPSS